MTAVTDVVGLIGWHTRQAIVSMSEDGADDRPETQDRDDRRKSKRPEV